MYTWIQTTGTCPVLHVPTGNTTIINRWWGNILSWLSWYSISVLQVPIQYLNSKTKMLFLAKLSSLAAPEVFKWQLPVSTVTKVLYGDRVHIRDPIFIITELADIMMTSWNGNTVRITSPLWGESGCLRCIPLTKGPVMRDFLLHLVSAYANCWTNSRESGQFRCLDVVVIILGKVLRHR